MESPPSLPEEVGTAAGSLPGRLVNLFATPGEVFEELKGRSTRALDWLTPVLLSCLTGVLFCLVVFSNDTVIRNMQEYQEQQMRKQLQKQVDAGKMSKEQVDQAVALTQRIYGPTLLKIVGSIGAVLATFLMVIVVALVIWLVGTLVFKGQFSFMKAVEAAALSGMIGALGGVIRMLLVIVTGNLAMTAGPVLLVGEFNPADRGHRMLAQLDLTTLWYVAVVALAMSKLAGTSYGRAAAWAFGVWAALVLVFTVPGWGR